MDNKAALDDPPSEALLPLHTFPREDVFVLRHERGTEIEMKNEQTILKQLNEERRLFKALPIAPIPGLRTSFFQSWMFLVRLPSNDTIFPSLTDRFCIDLEATVDRAEGTYSLVHLPSARIPNPYEGLELSDSRIARYAALRVDVPRARKTDEGENVEMNLMETFQVAKAVDDLDGLTLDTTPHQNIAITWDISSATFEAELAALRFLTEEKRLHSRCPGKKSMAAFKMILDFNQSWKTYCNLLDHFPHLQNPSDPFNKIPKILVQKFEAFNLDHVAAFQALSHIPNGLFFMNGCPGAGKTEWNMVVSALIQSRLRRGLKKKKRTPILFLVDINKTVDDAANRYHILCRQAGLKLRIIRMHGWPYEMRESNKLNKVSIVAKEVVQEDPDFTKRFLVTASIAQYTMLVRNPDTAPTLDEAAWEYFSQHKSDAFGPLRTILDKMATESALSHDDWKALRGSVGVLYKAVLSQADFVATTPVAVYGSFSRLYKPDIVFVDEAPHARELTTLIPIAYFDPIAWIFTGDVKQTRPFVKTNARRGTTNPELTFNPYVQQLQLSTMARAAAVNAINSQLLVNNRAFGNLHRLPSQMFYSSGMISGYEEKDRFPPSVSHLRNMLANKVEQADIAENRIVIQIEGNAEASHRNSFWNPQNHEWVLSCVQELLRDSEFFSVSRANQPGDIIIATPYSAAMKQYVSAVKDWPEEWQQRVEILTVDKSQGNQADVVFLDMVRSTTVGFMDDPQRLNVAITRARQAEIILMDEQMTQVKRRGRVVPTCYTSQVWNDAKSGGRLAIIPAVTDVGFQR